LVQGYAQAGGSNLRPVFGGRHRLGGLRRGMRGSLVLLVLRRVGAHCPLPRSGDPSFHGCPGCCPGPRRLASRA
jgi:hypothetical protein